MRTIVCVANINWDSAWQRHQELMTRFARHGYRVIFVENTGSRSVRVSDVWRALRELLRRTLTSRSSSEVGSGKVFVVSPKILPFPNAPVITELNSSAVARKIRKYMSDEQVTYWFYLPTRFTESLMKLLSPDKVVYDCVTNFSALDNGVELSRIEDRLIKASDVVFTDSRMLYEKHAHKNGVVRRVMSGVAEQFLGAGSVERPNELESIPEPRIGYFGSVSRWFDVDLMLSVAKIHTDMHFVLVGPTLIDVSRLSKLPNVHFLGTRSPESLRVFMDAMQLNLIPYISSTFTDYVFPAKLAQYFAAKPPVLAMETAELSNYADLIHVASSNEEFVASVKSIVAQGEEPLMTERRRTFASELRWERIFVDVMEVLDEKADNHLSCL